MNYLYSRILLIFVFFFFSSHVFAQHESQDFKKYMDVMIKDNASKQGKKKAKKFLRVLNSKNLSLDTKSKLLSVLIDFRDRKLKFNKHYIIFFELILASQGSDQKITLLNQFLDFLVSNHTNLTDIELNHLFFGMNKFLQFGILNSRDGFSWQSDSPATFLFHEGYPALFFLNSELILSNNYDTINLFKVDGYYNLLSKDFVGLMGEASFLTDYLLVDFSFSNFTLDLNKQFFSIDNAYINAIGDIRIACQGIYKNKLSLLDNYPTFKSNSNDLQFELFDGMHVVSGFELKGNSCILNRNSNPIQIKLRDDKMDYFFTSNHFELKDGELFGSNTSFSINNELGFLSHPAVQFSYNHDESKILLDRLSTKRGLNPIRNGFHGLNIYADRMEIDLIDDNCLFFHYAHGRDISVLFESDNYFHKNRYDDLFDFDINRVGLLIDFFRDKNHHEQYSIEELSDFSGLNFDAVLSILIDLEIFGFIDYNQFKQSFKVKDWLFNFVLSVDKKYDYDSFQIESLSGIGESVAEFDLYLHTMDIYRIHKMNIVDRFDIDFYPMSNKLKFIGDKSFLMDGNIYVGNFAFSGKDIEFNYDSFMFSFREKSVLSFLKSDLDEISASVIHFDYGALFLDSVNNKSGLKTFNNFPKFEIYNEAFLSYDNKPVNFLIHPFQIDYLNDMSLSNLSFPGVLYLDADRSSNIESTLLFNQTNNLHTEIHDVNVNLYNRNIQFSGSLSLNQHGLFGSGEFVSDYLRFNSKNIDLLSGKIVGFVENLKTENQLIDTPFEVSSCLLNYSIYDYSFLIKSVSEELKLYNDFNFLGDLYFDGEDLNGSGQLSCELFDISSSHHYFSNNNTMSADADFLLYNDIENTVPEFNAYGVTVEYEIGEDVFIYKNNTSFALPLIRYELDFDFLIFDTNANILIFNNNSVSRLGLFKSFKYGKTSYEYNALNAEYNLNNNELCVSGGIQLDIKRFWLQPFNNEFCVLGSGDFPVFENATLIKKRFLLSDKLINHQDVTFDTSLKHKIIND